MSNDCSVFAHGSNHLVLCISDNELVFSASLTKNSTRFCPGVPVHEGQKQSAEKCCTWTQYKIVINAQLLFSFWMYASEERIIWNICSCL